MDTNKGFLLILKKVYLKVRYYGRDKRFEQQKKFFTEEGVEVLQRYSEALNAAGLKFWLEFGTLLGYHREHDFISHDFDLDTGTYWENADKVKDALTKAGFELVREYHVEDDGGLEHCYQYKHTTIDVFYFRRDGDVLYCNSFYPIMNMHSKRLCGKKCPFRVKRIEVPDTGYVPTEFKGCKVYVPADCERYVIAHYGKDYRIPNPNYNWQKDSTNIKLYTYEEKPAWGILKKMYA